MEFILKTNGRSTAPFETWLKSLKELNDSLLVNFDFANSSIKSVAYTPEKTTVKRAEISFEEAGFEVEEIRDGETTFSASEYKGQNPVRLAIYRQLERFIKVVNIFSSADSYTLTLTAQSTVTANDGTQMLVTKADFRSPSLTMSVAGSGITDFYIISDEMFYDKIAAVQAPMKFSVDVETVKTILSVSTVYSIDPKKDIIEFKTIKNENGDWTLHAIDNVSHTYDFTIAYLTPTDDVTPAEVTLPISRGNFILGTKSDIDNSTVSISASGIADKIRFDTGDNINTVIAAVKV